VRDTEGGEAGAAKQYRSVSEARSSPTGDRKGISLFLKEINVNIVGAHCMRPLEAFLKGDGHAREINFLTNNTSLAYIK
jgi:hypothetical protein